MVYDLVCKPIMERLKQILNSPVGRRKSAPTQHRVFGVSLAELSATQRYKVPNTSAPSTPSSTNKEARQDEPELVVPYVVDRLCSYIYSTGEFILWSHTD